MVTARLVPSFNGNGSLFWIFFALFILFTVLSIYFNVWKGSGKKKKKFSSHIYLLILSAIAVLFYLLFLKYPVLIDLTEGNRYSLTPKTKEIIHKINFPVNILVFQDKDTPDLSMGRHGRKIFEHMQSILKQYQRQSPMIQVEFVNPDQKPLLVKQHQVRNVGDVILSSEQGTRYLEKEKMVKWGFEQSPYGQYQRKIESYKVEEKISSSLLSLIETGKFTILWLKGDGEVDLEASKGGASVLNEELKNNNFEIKTVSSFQEIPEGDVLVIAGPQKTLPEETVKAIEEFLKKGKVLIALLDPSLEGAKTGLNPLFSQYGIKPVNAIVVDEKQSFRNPLNIIPEYQGHSITSALKQENLPLIFSFASYLETEKEAKNLRIILKASGNAGVIRNLRKIRRSKQLNPQEKKQVKDGIVLGVLAENQENRSRVLVFSDSDFIKNELIRLGGNKDLIPNALNYLLDRKAPLSISKDVEKERRITLSEEAKSYFLYFFVFLLPLTIAVIGIFMGIRRRKQKNMRGSK
jgi:ABC-type uncharacterized transport system involved in gliding motility auxiliary subunit